MKRRWNPWDQTDMAGNTQQATVGQVRTAFFARPDLLFVLALAAAYVLAFAPMYLRLIDGPWRSEQDGHGPLIIAASAWLAWQSRHRIAAARWTPAPVMGWLLLLGGLALMIVTRPQDILMLEAASQIPVICGCILLVAGWNVLKILAFPIAFLVFSIPPPGWLMDAFTVPLKAKVSDWAAQLLYLMRYPVAQNGVMIMIGPYQLMVKDACAGMNSIFALSAIGVIYVYAFVRGSALRLIVLLASILPITVIANFTRVMALVLMAYYFGPDSIEGIYHDLTGFALFGVALLLFFLLDGLLISLAYMTTRLFRSGPSLVAPSKSTGV